MRRVINVIPLFEVILIVDYVNVGAAWAMKHGLKPREESQAPCNIHSQQPFLTNLVTIILDCEVWFYTWQSGDCLSNHTHTTTETERFHTDNFKHF